MFTTFEDTQNHQTLNTPTIPLVNTPIPPTTPRPLPPLNTLPGGGDPPGGPDPQPPTPPAPRQEGCPWAGWLLRLVAVIYQLYYFIVQGTLAVRAAIRWAHSHLQLLQQVGVALAVVVLGWSAGQALIRRAWDGMFRRRNAARRPPTTD